MGLLRKRNWLNSLAFLSAAARGGAPPDSVPAAKTAPKKKSTTAPAAKVPPAASTAAKKSSTKKKSTATARKPAPATWHAAQRAPTPDRYKEIQQALASKGYLQTDTPSGVWDGSSVDALKKFQQDQNLEPSGKLDSLSIIALGLGPKHDLAPAPAPESKPPDSKP